MKKWFKNICIFLLYIVLLLLHLCVSPLAIYGIILAFLLVFCLFCLSISKQINFGWTQLTLSLILVLSLIIPLHEYEDIILRPLRNLKKVGPLEFNQIDKFSSTEKLDTNNVNLRKNYINNGGFEIPLSNIQSRWGTGQYSNQIKLFNPEEPVYFIKFGGVIASADIASDESISGRYSLHIKQESSAVQHSVGLLEQEIFLEPGEYILSLKAKVKYIIGNAIWIRLDKRWSGDAGFEIPDDDTKGLSSWNLYQYTFKIDESGFFYRPCKEKNSGSGNCSYVKTEYKLDSGVDFRLIESGFSPQGSNFKTTFTIINQDQCEIWIDDIKLEKKK